MAQSMQSEPLKILARVEAALKQAEQAKNVV
jgi:hypothetical protein